MSNERNDLELASTLAPAVERILNEHIAESVDWQPQDLVPFDEGRNFAFLGGEDWSPEQSSLSPAAQLALTVAILHADDLPSYHRGLSYVMRKGPWWRWVGRWTAEENRHAIALRNYLTTSRGVDPVELERLRMAHMNHNLRFPAMSLLEVLANSALLESASALLHRNAQAMVGDKYAAAILDKIATDDEVQLAFYVAILDEAFDVAPNDTMVAIANRVRNFRSPRVELPGRDTVAELADSGIYDVAREQELVIAPVLKALRIAERTGLDEAGQAAADELAAVPV